MGDLIGHLTDAPIPNLLVLAGLAFVAIAVLGNITAKVNPSKNGRIASGVVGAALLAGGLMLHASSDATRTAATPPISPAPAMASTQAAATTGAASSPATPAATGAVSPQPASGAVPGASSLDGTWLTQKAHGRAINHIVIRQEGGLALVHAWMNCAQPSCDLGEQPATLSNGAADVQFVSGTEARSVTITPISATQVRVKIHFIDASRKADRNFDWIFVRSQ